MPVSGLPEALGQQKLEKGEHRCRFRCLDQSSHASEPKLRGNAYITIEDSSAHLQISMPLGKSRLFRNRYVNAQCSVQSAPSGKPEDARITSIVVNGRPVGEEILSWQYGTWSFKRYMSDWTGRTNLKTFEISDGRIILETNGSE